MISVGDVEDLRLDSSTSSPIIEARADKAWSYFEYATADLDDDQGGRSFINAVSNAKRALHFRLETISEAFGIVRVSRSRKYTFPQLFKFASDCGVASPRILGKLNRVRNKVEHRYVVPEGQQAEDFVDVVELFLRATDKLINEFPEEMELTSSRDNPPGVVRRSVQIKIEPGSGIVRVHCTTLQVSADELMQRAEVEFEKLKSEVEEGKAPTDDFQYSELEPKLTAYRRATQGQWQSCEQEVSIMNDETYFAWIAFILEKHRSGYASK